MLFVAPFPPPTHLSPVQRLLSCDGPHAHCARQAASSWTMNVRWVSSVVQAAAGARRSPRARSRISRRFVA